MSQRLTNKQLLVLDVVRRHPDGLTVKEVCGEVMDETTCPTCNGTGEGGDHERYSYHRGATGFWCDSCYGRGAPFFDYANAYQALKRLRSVGLVSRRCKRDEWGDELPTHVYLAEQRPDPDDPLERAFALPATEGPVS